MVERSPEVSANKEEAERKRSLRGNGAGMDDGRREGDLFLPFKDVVVSSAQTEAHICREVQMKC